MKYLSCILLVIFFTGCASNKANRKLKRAERLISQAEQLGVKWHTDTIKTKFKFEGANATFNWNMVLNRKESTRERPVFNDTTIYINKIKFQKKDSLIYIKCPDNEGEVPTVITKEIKTGTSVLEVVQVAVLVGLLCLIIGAVLCRVFWK